MAGMINKPEHPDDPAERNHRDPRASLRSLVRYLARAAARAWVARKREEVPSDQQPEIKPDPASSEEKGGDA
jgi:hypothetical protein